MPSALKQFFVLFKGGIVIFVIIGGLAGYALGYQPEVGFDLSHFLLTLLGLGAISAGSFGLNQVQERKIDAKMKRTANRPVASGWISARDASVLSVLCLGIGLFSLSLVEPLAALLGGFTVVLYNVFYTAFWKRYWAFAAVPGAIPGAMPVVIGYAAVQGTVFTAECFYLFMVLFLWQMPHFWAIAIKLKDDYEKGGIPTLPTQIGAERTIMHIGLYTFVYLALAIASPWFVATKYVYMLVVVPVALMMLREFIKYANAKGEERWLPFFMWTNVSVLVFLIAPVIDKWAWTHKTVRLVTGQ